MMNLKIHMFAATTDVRSLMFRRVLEALPCPQSFSVQLFISVWNTVRHGYQIGQNEDIQSLSDGIFAQLILPNSPAGSPVITKFLASYVCHHCGFSEDNLEDWEPKSYSKIPIINISQQNQPLGIGALLTDFVRLVFEIRCSSCNRRTHGRYEVDKGKFTLIRFNRIDNTFTNVVRTRLSDARTGVFGEQLIGSLISCVSHIGNVQGGHYVSYHKIRNQWYRNSDDNQIQLVNYHPFDCPNSIETVNYVVYDNS